MNKLLIICGPTATGKTALALSLAKKFNGELIAADSRQVYRGMDVGTGKDLDTCSKYNIPIWMYDVVNPDEEFSVSHYCALATTVIEHIYNAGKLPIIVGGTGLYIRSLIEPIETATIPPNPVLRKQLSLFSKEKLQERLQKIAPAVWVVMNYSDRNNPRRLVRKIEIAVSGQAIQKETQGAIYDSYSIGLRAPFRQLYKRIDERVDKRVGEGILDEVSVLLQKRYSWNLPSMSSLGYREWKPYFEKKQSKAQCIQQWKYDEHGYARRQLTWFKKQEGIHWFDIAQLGYQDNVTEHIAQWYT